MITNQDKIERYDLIVGYFQKILNDRADKLIDEYVYYDEWKHPRKMDLTERQEKVIEDFLYEMDNIGFNDFAELMAHEIYCERISENNQFYDHVYGNRLKKLVPIPINKKEQSEYNKRFGIKE